MSTMRGLLLSLAGLVMIGMSTGNAQTVSDAASCEAAVQKSEKGIVRAPLTADDLNTLVSLADQAKSACSASDFAKASKIIEAIEAKLATVASN